MDFLFELGLEEIPARFMNGLLEDLQKQFLNQLKTAGLQCASAETLGTYRRLTLFVSDIPAEKPELRKLAKGPKLAQAKDAGGQWTPAALGFAKKNGVTYDQFKEVDGCVAAEVVQPAEKTLALLPKLIEAAVKAMHLPIAMYWNAHEGPFVRPLHWLLALYGSDIVPVTLFGIQAGRETRGHRFLSSAAVSLSQADRETYIRKLAETHVLVDFQVRWGRINAEIQQKAAELGAQPDCPPALLQELAYITEEPKLLVASFEASFLSVPEEILILTMQKNQKYVPLKKNGRLTNQFLVLYEGRDAAVPNIREGNERVLRARLADAAFFVAEDQKVPLDDFLTTLGRTSFIEGLGSIRQKIDRNVALASAIAKSLNPKMAKEARNPNAGFKLDRVERVAKYAKADLASQAVFEFPELQGVMGKYYYAHQFADADAEEMAVIEEHWWPKGAGAGLPSTALGAVVAVADKLDTLCGCFAVGKIPTGSSDPYALRRAAQAIIDIVDTFKWELGIAHLLSEVKFDSELNEKFQLQSQNLIDFLTQRFEHRLKNIYKIDHDIAAAILVQSWERPVYRGVEAARALQKRRDVSDFKSIVKTAIRVERITLDSDGRPLMLPGFVEEEWLQEDEEKKLWKLLQEIKMEVSAALANSLPDLALDKLFKLASPVEIFFEKVLVNHEDQNLRENRIKLLMEVRNVFKEIADFEKVVLPG